MVQVFLLVAASEPDCFLSEYVSVVTGRCSGLDGYYICILSIRQSPQELQRISIGVSRY